MANAMRLGPKHHSSWLAYLCLCRGSIWGEVLPYCILNCTVTYVLSSMMDSFNLKFGFSPTGYGMMTFLVSFLVIEKVRVALDRYMCLRDALGRAFVSLRELNQMIITFTEITQMSTKIKDESELWGLSIRQHLTDVINITVDIMRDHDKMVALAFRKKLGEVVDLPLDCMGCSNAMDLVQFDNKTEKRQKGTDEVNQYDPMIQLHAFRYHTYSNFGLGLYGEDPLELFQKMKIVELCRIYMDAFTEIVKFQTTPIPFPLLQMGRTFLLIYTFAMPMALIGFVPDYSLSAVLLFIFFLTYGYVGLELVAFRLLAPFGTDTCDMDVDGMRNATVYGMQSDWKMYEQRKGMGKTYESFKAERLRMSALRKKSSDSVPLNQYSYRGFNQDDGA
uniref:Bestrophin homolog n=1 Tax=Corethron hystrix TaxID=216773 RepID=A0A6U5IGZ0_9STRA|mmetsp:Transcript_33747/g.77904  ORF Transcript_33747/g.77904 Transcript_33747/m.77904 type:complete len:390 (+) Transcript_33747:415-1584(+)